MGRKYTDADETLIRAAADIAHSAHAGQVDKVGREYFLHPLAVANLARQAGESAEVVALCFLHDVVEDTCWTFEDVRARLVEVTDEDIHDIDGLIRGLDAITHRKHEPRVEYYKRILREDLARRAKQYDLIHNTLPERLAVLSPLDRDRLTGKYAAAQDFLGFPRTV